MEVYNMRIKVGIIKSRWCSRSKANKINDFLNSLSKPDRAALFAEAKEFEDYAKANKLFRAKKS